MASELLSLQYRQQMTTLLDAIVLQSQDDQRPAITYIETGQKPTVITFAQFRQHVQQAAVTLQTLGVHPAELVIIAHTQNLESIFAFWGALYLGAIPSMLPPLTEKLDPDIYVNSMATLITHSGARLVLTNDDFAPLLANIVENATVHGSISRQLATASTTITPYQPDPDNIAFLQHSSGTTGLQKGVALSHTAVLNQLASYCDALQLTEDDVIASWLPLYHDMGLIAGFLLPLIQGVHLVLMSPFDWVRHPALLLRAISDYQATLCWLPNFAYNHCARRIRKRDTEGLVLRSIRAFINCSEPVMHNSHLQFAERFAINGVSHDQLAVSYAMAENTFAVTQTPIGEPARLDTVDRRALENAQHATPCTTELPTAQTNVSCGPPIPGVDVAVLNDLGNTLPERSVGELAIKSTFMLTGYYKRPDLNADIWQDGWFRTGDMGYMTDGEVYVVGRRKDLIINAGKNVYPQDLEAIANTVEGVYPGRVVAFGVYDERDGTELIGIVAETQATDADTRQRIAQQIRQRVAQQTTVTVSYVHVTDPKWLIKTSSGKIARASNRDKWLQETRSQAP